MTSVADIQQIVEDEIQRRVTLTREAIHSAIISANARGTGVVRTHAYGAHIFAKDESELYHKIVGGLK